MLSRLLIHNVAASLIRYSHSISYVRFPAVLHLVSELPVETKSTVYRKRLSSIKGTFLITSSYFVLLLLLQFWPVIGRSLFTTGGKRKCIRHSLFSSSLVRQEIKRPDGTLINTFPDSFIVVVHSLSVDERSKNQRCHSEIIHFITRNWLLLIGLLLWVFLYRNCMSWIHSSSSFHCPLCINKNS